jgi:hypothetical protein
MLPPEEERVEFIFAHLISGNGPYRTATLNVMPILPLAAAFFFVTMIIATEKYIILYRISFFAIEPTVRT